MKDRQSADRLLAVTVLLGLALCFGSPLNKEARERVGSVEHITLETPHPLRESVWSAEIRRPGAGFLKARIGRAEITGRGQVLVFDGNGEAVAALPGAHGSAWLPAVAGDAMRVEVRIPQGSLPWGVSFDALAVGGASLTPPGPESTCGIDDKLDAACYEAARRAAGLPVGRMLFVRDGGTYVCTGSLVSPAGHFLTNNHCIATQAHADSLEIWWRYEAEECGGGASVPDRVTNGSELLVTDETLDCTLLRLSGENLASVYGHLQPDPSPAQVGAGIWIPQHPSGTRKKFAVESDMDPGGLALIQGVDLDGYGTETDIGYWADTAGGSSGSPVLTEENGVIALHHWGVGGHACDQAWMNQGVKMSLIYPLIQPHLFECVLYCSARVPEEGTAGVLLDFEGGAEAFNCPEAPEYEWEFGDGTTSFEAFPQHAYLTEGTYAWTLSVTAHRAQCSQTGIVAVGPPSCRLDCGGEASPAAGIAPLAVSFTGSAVAQDCQEVPRYAWDFGDGSFSDAQHPAHTYETPGSYTWLLTVSADDANCTGGGTVTVGEEPPPPPGDCDLDGLVSIGEVQRTVNMFLGVEPVGCGADRDGDDVISIGEVQRVINGFLGAGTSLRRPNASAQ